MQITDPIADMLTRIRNANNAKHDTVDVPASNMKKSIAQILLDEGYIKNFQLIDDGTQGVIRIALKYNAGKEKVISGPVSYTHLRIMATAYDIIKRPIITEQSMEQTEMKRYTFEVAKTANKIEIAKAIEEIFGVKVAKVNTLNMQGKEKRMGMRPAGRRPSWKKAVVTLTADSKTIEFFEGMV